MNALSMFALVLVQAAAPAPSSEPAAKSANAAPIGSDAIWSPPPNFVATFHAACDRQAGKHFGACFVEQMEKAGAPPAALAFARRIDGQGYLRNFREAGRVDLACAELPFRANENRACYLVNGSPPLIDVDDLPKSDRDAVAQNLGYRTLAKSHPDLALFPGPRADASRFHVAALPDGEVAIVVPYALREGCNACKVVAEVDLRFVFDDTGRFLKIELQRINKLP